MNDIWSIIGLSSLIASVVTVTLGIVRDVLVERYRFKRESEAGYIQNQIGIYSRIHYFLKRFLKGATMPYLFGERQDKVREINVLIERNSSLLKPRIVNEWLAIWALFEEYLEDPKQKKLKETTTKAAEHGMQLALMIENVVNNNLILKYRKIVGKTVPTLEF